MNHIQFIIITAIFCLFMHTGYGNSLDNIAIDSHQIKLEGQKIAIEKTEQEIATLAQNLTQRINQENQELDNIALILSNANGQVDKSDLDTLITLYQEVSLTWRTLADESLNHKILHDVNPNQIIIDPNLKTIPPAIANPEVIAQYHAAYLQLTEQYDSLVQLYEKLKNSNQNYKADLFLKSGKLRAQLLQKILAENDNFIVYDETYFEDLTRELKLIPYRPIAVFYSKLLQYKQISNSKFSGTIFILKQAALLIILIMIIILSSRLFSKLIESLNVLGNYCIKKSFQHKQYESLANVIIKVTPYSKWIILSAIFLLADKIIQYSAIAELSALTPYFQYYFLYKIFRIFAHNNLSTFFHGYFNHYENKNRINNKIKITTQLLGLYLLSSIYLSHLTQTIVRKAYFYTLILDLFSFGLLLILCIIAFCFKEELIAASKKILSPKYHQFVSKLPHNKKSAAPFYLLLFVIIISKSFFNYLISFLQRYDFFKSLLSQLYRKKLESAAKKNSTEDDAHFDSLYEKEFIKQEASDHIRVKNHPYNQVRTIINHWQEGIKEENSIAIYGSKNIGKSKFVANVVKEYPNLKTVTITINDKITEPKDFITLMSQSLKEEDSAKDLFKTLSKTKTKTIIILDECHNLFLAKENGFDALKTFFNFLIKIDNPNLLWMTIFNAYPWYYLENALKINNYFRHIIKLSRWGDDNIREFILSKHEKTGFKLTYDPLIFSLKTLNSQKEFEDIQLKFFQIIWNQSAGNPNIAAKLWLSSVKQINHDTIKVSLPKIVKSSELEHLSDDHLFVYSAIIKHHSLSVIELSHILSITKEEALNIVRMGLEKGYLDISQKSKRYIISSSWQNAINQILLNRNFIYEQ